MATFLLIHGLPALFVLSFLAATIIPLGSEWLLVALLLQGQDPGPAVTVATLGNFLGGCTTYGLGYLGAAFVLRKIPRVSARETGRAMTIYRRYGSWSLLFSWLPIIGDPLCLVAGSCKLHPVIFAIFVFSGKLARYWLLARITLMGAAAA